MWLSIPAFNVYFSPQTDNVPFELDLHKASNLIFQFSQYLNKLILYKL